MKTTHIILLLSAVFMGCQTTTNEEKTPESAVKPPSLSSEPALPTHRPALPPPVQHAHLGVQLSPQPLPPLLRKHLALDADQGVVVENVLKGSPADTMGLQRDDILTSLNGKPIIDSAAFTNSIRSMNPGDSVTLKLVREGQHLELTAALEPRPDVIGEWKHPPRDLWSALSDMEQESYPFPGWLGWGGFMDGFAFELPAASGQRIFSQHFFSQTPEGIEQFDVTIVGDPKAPESQIMVRVGDQTHETTLDKIDELPETFRDKARQALDNARSGVMSYLDMGGDDLREQMKRMRQDMETLRNRMQKDMHMLRKHMHQGSPGKSSPDKSSPDKAGSKEIKL